MQVQTVKEFVISKGDIHKINNLVGFLIPHIKTEDEKKQINILQNEGRYTSSQFKKMLIFLTELKPRIVNKRVEMELELAKYKKDQVDHLSIIVRPYDFFATIIEGYNAQLKTIDEIGKILVTQTEEEE